MQLCCDAFVEGSCGGLSVSGCWSASGSQWVFVLVEDEGVSLSMGQMCCLGWW